VTTSEIIKTVILGFFVILAALWVSYAFTQLIYIQETAWLIWTLVASIIFISFFILQGFFLKNVFFAAIMTAFESLALGAFFIGNYSLLRAFFLLIIWLLFFGVKMAVAREIQNNLKIKFFKVAGITLGFAARGLAVFFTVFYLSFIAFQDSNIIKSQLTSLGTLMPAFSLNQTVGDFIRSFSNPETGSSFISPNLDIPIPKLNVQLQGVAQERIESTLTDIAKVRVHLTDSVVDVLYKTASNRLAGLSPQMKAALWVVAAVTVYLTIRFLLYIMGWASVALAFVLYYALMTFHFFRITAESVDKENITL